MYISIVDIVEDIVCECLHTYKEEAQGSIRLLDVWIPIFFLRIFI